MFPRDLNFSKAAQNAFLVFARDLSYYAAIGSAIEILMVDKGVDDIFCAATS